MHWEWMAGQAKSRPKADRRQLALIYSGILNKCLSLCGPQFPHAYWGIWEKRNQPAALQGFLQFPTFIIWLASLPESPPPPASWDSAVCIHPGSIALCGTTMLLGTWYQGQHVLLGHCKGSSLKSPLKSWTLTHIPVAMLHIHPKRPILSLPTLTFGSTHLFRQDNPTPSTPSSGLQSAWETSLSWGAVQGDHKAERMKTWQGTSSATSSRRVSWGRSWAFLWGWPWGAPSKVAERVKWDNKVTIPYTGRFYLEAVMVRIILSDNPHTTMGSEFLRQPKTDPIHVLQSLSQARGTHLCNHCLY